MFPQPRRRPQTLARPNPNARFQPNFRPTQQRVNTQSRFQRGPQQMSRMPMRSARAPMQMQRYPAQSQFARQQFTAQRRPIQQFPTRAPAVKIKGPGFFDGFFSLGVNPPKPSTQKRKPGFIGRTMQWNRRSAMMSTLLRRR
ncbi:Uncharacterised protein [uncultured archaeon]|nr:Uncharacterised protein [uncultured archaeon]